jgi:hypothetical protein
MKVGETARTAKSARRVVRIGGVCSGGWSQVCGVRCRWKEGEGGEAQELTPNEKALRVG